MISSFQNLTKFTIIFCLICIKKKKKIIFYRKHVNVIFFLSCSMRMNILIDPIRSNSIQFDPIRSHLVLFVPIRSYQILFLSIRSYYIILYPIIPLSCSITSVAVRLLLWCDCVSVLTAVAYLNEVRT